MSGDHDERAVDRSLAVKHFLHFVEIGILDRQNRRAQVCKRILQPLHNFRFVIGAGDERSWIDARRNWRASALAIP